MSKHWKEKTDPKKHLDFMSTSHIDGLTLESSKAKNNGWIYFVRECGFTFQFTNVEQLDQMIEYFSQKVHPSTRLPNVHLEHYWQRWYERIPAGLMKNTKRLRILNALKKAKADFTSS